MGGYIVHLTDPVCVTLSAGTGGMGGIVRFRQNRINKKWVSSL